MLKSGAGEDLKILNPANLENEQRGTDQCETTITKSLVEKKKKKIWSSISSVVKGESNNVSPLLLGYKGEQKPSLKGEKNNPVFCLKAVRKLRELSSDCGSEIYYSFFQPNRNTRWSEEWLSECEFALLQLKYPTSSASCLMSVEKSVYTPIIYTLPKKAKNVPKTLFAAKLNKLRLPPKLTDENQETDAELVNETKQIQQVQPIKANNEQQKDWEDNEFKVFRGRKGLEVKIQRGLFREIKSICPDNQKEGSEEEVNDEEYRIILCFCTLPTIEQNNEIKLEKTWRYWTGARRIYRNLNQEFNLKKITFFKEG
ncbi:uncharacterized protein LOC111695745 [Eurytemora carolleeae]|uniref:uncharacterized protein LOC111695745 n=1 Tax=Eurytemora carolleeae TaxID=1294199 RepID=UPI000C77863B|nr:uncharacterized protein LOC111695745 [Eurytemora carolleeae]|eukprot:XP_023320941.1 uncharacterized protein LOC111695745 [Eurytemora affinis]